MQAELLVASLNKPQKNMSVHNLLKPRIRGQIFETPRDRDREVGGGEKGRERETTF
jgi:hypothetical protein